MWNCKLPKNSTQNRPHHMQTTPRHATRLTRLFLARQCNRFNNSSHPYPTIPSASVSLFEGIFSNWKCYSSEFDKVLGIVHFEAHHCSCSLHGHPRNPTRLLLRPVLLTHRHHPSKHLCCTRLYSPYKTSLHSIFYFLYIISHSCCFLPFYPDFLSSKVSVYQP